MCGIGVLIAPISEQQDSENAAAQVYRAWPSVLHNVQRRGPDCLKTIQHEFQSSIAGDSHSRSWTLSLTSSVLSLRGEGITAQPLSSSDGRLLLAWNGQIFDWDTTGTGSDRASSSKVRLDSGHNDGLILLDRIQAFLDGQDEDGSGASCEHALNAALAEIEGPYAFVLLDLHESRLYFGRDPLGRRSLLLHRTAASSSIAIVSVASDGLLSAAQEEDSGATLTELACASLWTLDLGSDPTSPQPLPRLPSRFTSPLLLNELRPSTPAPVTDASSPAQVRAAFLAVLSESVRRRVTNIHTEQPADEAHVAVLFSGGLDCTTLALLADRYVPEGQPIDLLNVGFENVRAIEAAKHEREKRLRSALKAAAKKGAKAKSGTNSKNAGTTEASSAAQQERAEPLAGMVVDNEEGLLNDIYAVPDRLTGLASYAELCALAPHRRWNFVEINVPYAEYTAHRAEVETLMAPSSSVMDLSIGSALFFASRARGHLRPPPTLNSTQAVPYTSPARVLISGLGADELLGGYSRHRQAFARDSLAGLTSELQLDLDRLPERNLGRDDRILSCHAKEARYPFLNRAVLDFLTATRVELKVDLNRIAIEGAGGDKRLLRDLAYDLGLVGASQLKKRAMQFGTRSAKIDSESRNVKGHHKLS